MHVEIIILITLKFIILVILTFFLIKSIREYKKLKRDTQKDKDS